MKTHVFVNHCINFEEILQETTLSDMLAVVAKQAKTEEAKMRVDFANYKDYGTDQWCPAYFGMFVEWLAQYWLNHYGPMNHNIHGVDMNNSVGELDEDYGTDGEGFTLKRKRLKSTGREAEPNSKIYIQVKGTLNRTKEYRPNDGSRLPNFGMNAMSASIVEGVSYQARYVVFTTGKGLHYSMEKMCHKLIEVIAYNDIKIMDNDTVFLNVLRSAAGLSLLPVAAHKMDAEAEFIHNND